MPLIASLGQRSLNLALPAFVGWKSVRVAPHIKRTSPPVAPRSFMHRPGKPNARHYTPGD